MLNIPYNFGLTETKPYHLTTFNYLILMPLIYNRYMSLDFKCEISLHSDKVKWLLWPVVFLKFSTKSLAMSECSTIEISDKYSL